MSETLYGVLGALGGALATSAAAYWGPLQMQRRSLAEARLAAAEERAAAAEERAAVEAQAAVLREQARDEAQGAKRESATKRIIRIRTSTRDWSDLLARTIQDLGLGRTVDIERFDEQVLAARAEAQAAFDQALHDGLWLQQSAYGYPATVAFPSLYGYGQAPASYGYPHPEAVRGVQPSGNADHRRVLTALKRATELTREAVIKGELLDDTGSAALRNSLDAADEARGALSSELLNRLEQVADVTPLGGPSVIGVFPPLPDSDAP